MFSIIEIVFISFALAVDCFTASFALGVSHKRVRYDILFAIALSFGLFQALMPVIGWGCTMQLGEIAQSVDHWIAFVLLAFIGGKMIVEALGAKEEDVVEEYDTPLKIRELFVLAVATSIDALAVGITFAFLKYPIIEAITIIGITTFIISLAGVCVGNFFGSKYKSKAELVGGSILVLLGLRILLTHLGIL